MLVKRYYVKQTFNMHGAVDAVRERVFGAKGDVYIGYVRIEFLCDTSTL